MSPASGGRLRKSGGAREIAPRGRKQSPGLSPSGADPVRNAAHAALLHYDRSPGPAESLVSRFTDDAFDGRDRAFLRELVYGVLRWRNRLDAAYGRFLLEPPARLSRVARAALRLGTYQLLFLDRVPAHGAVDTSVTLVGRSEGRKGKGLVNAVLRKVASEGFTPPEGIEERLVVWESHPRWLVRRWIAALGEERAQARCEANNREGPLVLRANSARAGAGELARSLAADGVTTAPGNAEPDCLRVAALGVPLTETASFSQGAFVVQDEAAALVSRFAGVVPGDRALDACAAPGGKSAVLSWMAGERGFVAAGDLSLPRLGRVRENCARISAPVCLLAMDVGKPPFRDVFDVVLVDAPCSGLGVFRRHPDARWRLRGADLPRHRKTQIDLLAGAAQAVRPGGRLVYAVCSNEPEETEEVVAAFGAAGFVAVAEGGAENLPPLAHRFVGKDGALRILPEAGEGLDGFFAAAWRREG